MNFILKKKGLSHKAKKKEREEMQTAMNRPQDPPNPPPLPPCWQQRGSRYNQIKGARQQDSHCSDCVYLH